MIKQVTQTPSGKTSGTKFWYTISMIVASFVVIFQTIHDKLLWEIFAIYLMVTGSAQTLSKFLALKYGEKYYDSSGNNQQATGNETSTILTSRDCTCELCPTPNTRSVQQIPSSTEQPPQGD